MNTYGIYDENLFEDDDIKQAQRKYNRKSKVTKEKAQYASNFVKTYPNVSPSLLVGFTELGLDVNDPKVKEIVLKDYFVKENSYNNLKESLYDRAKEQGKRVARYGFAGFQGIWEGSLPRLVRYLEARQQGQSHEEARKKSRTELGANLLKQGLDAELGSGIFPAANDIENTEEYKNLLNNSVDPEIARNFVMNNVLDENIYESAKRRAEQNIQFVGERAEKFKEAGLDPTVTIGRFLFKPFDRIVEPGTDAYNIITGSIDLVAQLIGDPTSVATLGISNVRKGKQAFTAASKIKRFEQAGLVSGMRKTLLGPTTKQYLASNNGTTFKKFLWDNADNPNEIISRSSESIKQYDFLNRLSKLKSENAGSFDEVGNVIMDKFLDEELLFKVTYGQVPKKINQGNGLTKAMQRTYGSRVVVSDPDDAVLQLNRFINLATNDADRKKDFMQNAVKALGEDDSITAVNNLLVDTLENTMKQELKNVLKPKLGSKTEEWINESTKVFVGFQDDIQEANKVMGIYASDGVGNQLPITDFIKKEFGVEADFLTRPVTTTQLAKEIHLPNPKDIIKAGQVLESKLGKYGAFVIDNMKGESVKRFLDGYYSRVWKPLVLLRPAWTTRVIFEEQLRLATAGVNTAINSPLSMIASMFRKDRNFKAPQIDLVGSFENNMSASKALNEGIGSLMANSKKWGQTTNYTFFNKGIDKDYAANAFNNVMQHYYDPISKRLAKIQMIDDTLEYNVALAKLKNEIIDKTSVLNKEIKNVTASKSHPFYGAGDNKNITDEFVDYINAAVAQTAGGNLNVNQANRAATWIERRGDKRLLAFISSDDARILKKEFDGLQNVDKAKYWNGDLLEQEYNNISKTLQINQKNVIKEFIGEFGEVLPKQVRGPVKVTEGILNKYDAVVNTGFNLLMTVPTNKLSRMPAFKNFYWENVAKNAQFASKEVIEQIIKRADEAGLATSSKKYRNYYKQIKQSKGNIEGISDVKIFDQVASAEALTRTKDLLYDISTRSRIGNKTRLLFPFGEAYVEIFSTWAKLIAQETGRPIRRVQQVIEAGRKPNPVFDETGQKGFFFVNPKNGEEVFGYPGEGLIQKWMFPELKEGGVNVNLPVYLSSLNIAASIIPGFGPIIQIPAAIAYNYGSPLFEEESFLQTLFFGDFSVPKVRSLNDLRKAAIPTPPWAEKIYQAFFQETDEAKRLFMNTTIDIYRAYQYAGMGNDSNPEAAEFTMDDAAKKARNIMLIRGISQFVGPSGIATPEFELTDKNGNLYLFETLAKEYRAIKDNVGGDDTEATQIFIQRFGEDPVNLITAKSTTIRKRPLTVDGTNWARRNKEIVDKYTYTSFYFAPPDDSEFSYSAYTDALYDGDLVPRTPEQWERARNKLLGSLEFEQFLRDNNLHNRSDNFAQTAKSNKQKQLADKYFGYGLNIPLSVRKPETEELIQELYTWINPITYKINEDIKDYNVAKAWALYAQQRDAVSKRSVDLGYKETSWKTTRDLLPYRTFLRDYADKLFLQYPEFEPLYRDILERELKEEYQDLLLEESLNR